jgi:hypothetical protein
MDSVEAGIRIKVLRDVLHKHLGWSHAKLDRTTIGEATQAWENLTRSPGSVGDVVLKSYAAHSAAKPATTSRPVVKQSPASRPTVRPVVKQVAPTPKPSTIMARAGDRIQDAVLSVLPEPVRLAIAVQEKISKQVATPEYQAQIADRIASAVESAAQRERLSQLGDQIGTVVKQIQARNQSLLPGGHLSGTAEAIIRRSHDYNPHPVGSANWHRFRFEQASQ